MAENISLNELARQMDMNKSHLHYWVKRGLLKPKEVVGGTFVFPRVETKRLIRKISTLRNKGKTIDEIKKVLNKK